MGARVGFHRCQPSFVLGQPPRIGSRPTNEAVTSQSSRNACESGHLDAALDEGPYALT